MSVQTFSLYERRVSFLLFPALQISILWIVYLLVGNLLALPHHFRVLSLFYAATALLPYTETRTETR